jgi:hypothetical protein
MDNNVVSFVKVPKYSNVLPGPVVDYDFNKNYKDKIHAIQKEQSEFQTKNGPLNPLYQYRNPSTNNPMMNVPIMAYDTTQLYSDYNRYDTKNEPTYATKKTSDEVDKTWGNNLFQDAGGFFFNKENSQREWYSTPVGSVPNNQDTFASWLYSSSDNCKNGSINMRYGLKYDNSSLLCTGNDVSVPTNFGLLNK